MVYNSEIGASLQTLQDKSQISGKDSEYYCGKLRKKKVKHETFIRNYSSRLFRALSTIRAGIARACSREEKERLDQKDKVNFKIYDVTARLTNSYIAHIANYLTK